jgi:hypothetical protein
MAFDKVKNFLNVEIEDGLPGIAHIRSMTDPHEGMHEYNATLSLEVHVEGWEPYEVSHTCWVEADYHLKEGWQVPVTVDRENRERLKIEWSLYRTPDEARQELAARALEGDKEAQRELLAGTDQGPPVDEDKANQAVREMNELLAPSYVTGPKPAPAPAPDPAARLRKLAELRDAGLLTDADFAAKRAEILDEL